MLSHLRSQGFRPGLISVAPKRGSSFPPALSQRLHHPNTRKGGACWGPRLPRWATLVRPLRGLARMLFRKVRGKTRGGTHTTFWAARRRAQKHDVWGTGKCWPHGHWKRCRPKRRYKSANRIAALRGVDFGFGFRVGSSHIGGGQETKDAGLKAGATRAEEGGSDEKSNANGGNCADDFGAGARRAGTEREGRSHADRAGGSPGGDRATHSGVREEDGIPGEGDVRLGRRNAQAGGEWRGV